MKIAEYRGRNLPRLMWKLRWYYVAFFQKKQKLFLYRSYRHYLIHKKKAEIKRKEPNYLQKSYMTKRVRPTAGIGDQLANWISGLYYARFFGEGLDYAAARLYPESWNDFLGFDESGANERKLLREGHYRKVRLPMFDENDPKSLELIRNIMASYAGKRVIFLLELDQIYSAQYGVAGEISDRFEHAAARKKDKLIYAEDMINIAVHIRRGDIMRKDGTVDSALLGRYLSNDYYVKAIKIAVGKALEMDRKYRIYIFSQGKREDFADFLQFENVKYCLNMDERASFLHMIRADILITSKSSFSYKPALMNRGIKICPADFWHSYPEEKDWILLGNDGNPER